MRKNGTVKWFNYTKGYGFILDEETEQDIFVHKSSVERAGLRGLDEGQRLTFEIITDKGRQSADKLQLINEAA